MSHATPEAAYLALPPGELARRAAEAAGRLRRCDLCPRRCGVDREAGETGVCGVGRAAPVASAGPHHGEEACLRGSRGSGTVFFGGCNLNCVFCQNADISHAVGGAPLGAGALADVFLQVQAMGCHNLNLVTPSHVVPQILEALALAVPLGLRLPIVYNTGGYDEVGTLRLLDGIVDVYMPDFKVWDEDVAARYLTARDYPSVARAAVAEMHRQVGDLRIGEDGLAVRGLLVRHLVMPGGLAGSEQVFAWLAALSRETLVNVMGQYRPCARVREQGDFAAIARTPTRSELAEAMAAARAAGLARAGRAP